MAPISITSSGETLQSTQRAKEEVKDANFEVDHHQLMASFHFDDESLSAGTERIRISESKSGNGKAARKALGGALHTIHELAPEKWTPRGLLC